MLDEPYGVEITGLRRQVLEMATRAKEGHIPSALSILDIVFVLYSKVLPGRKLEYGEVDRFILSKGHGSLALYVVLAKVGVIEKFHLDTFCDFDSILGGHPDRTKVPGVEASTGSLGHGLPMAVGLALSQRIRLSGSRTFVLIGDGEANEGTTWESAMLAGHHQLNNLTCIIDHNRSTDRALVVDSLRLKFESFGWETLEVDGHDPQVLERVLAYEADKPLAVIANTIKGKGVSGMENNPAWHHGAPTSDQLAEMLKALS